MTPITVDELIQKLRTKRFRDEPFEWEQIDALISAFYRACIERDKAVGELNRLGVVDMLKTPGEIGANCGYCRTKMSRSPTGDWCNGCGYASPGLECKTCGFESCNEVHLSRKTGLLCDPFDTIRGEMQSHAIVWALKELGFKP